VDKFPTIYALTGSEGLVKSAGID